MRPAIARAHPQIEFYKEVTAAMYDPRFRFYRATLGTGSRIALGIVIFAFGLFLISPVAEWLLKLVGWIAMIGGAVLFAAGLWAALRGRGASWR